MEIKLCGCWTIRCFAHSVFGWTSCSLSCFSFCIYIFPLSSFLRVWRLFHYFSQVPPRSAFSLELKSIEFGEASESLPTYTAEEGVEKSAKVYIDEAFRVRLLLRSRYPREEHLVIRKNDTSFPSIRCVGSGAAVCFRLKKIEIAVEFDWRKRHIW